VTAGDEVCTTYLADHSGGALLVLAHGAGAGQTHPFMVSTARGLAARGIDVVTFDFLYIQEGRKAPDRTATLEATFLRVIETARQHELFKGHRLFIGGKSMGGRIATHLAAIGVDGLAGVIALGYPLHPPARPAMMRTSHLPSITVPVLIVQGARDTFGTPAELRPVIDTMPAPVTLHVVAGGDHSLNARAQSRGAVSAEYLDATAKWILKIHSVYG
jgi:predicted alpha/beta-hydrolase family hydrolase